MRADGARADGGGVRAGAPSILTRIVERKRLRLAEAASARPLGDLKRRIADGVAKPPRSLSAALSSGDGSAVQGVVTVQDGSGVPRVIAELKRRSPSRGLLARAPAPGAAGAAASGEDGAMDLGAVHRAYARGGADALSVLTEQDFFDGSLDDLRRLAALTSLPVLRKDFLFEEYQIYEAREAGADAVLLIVGLLEPARLAGLLALTVELGMEALVEVHTKGQLAEAARAGSGVIGINSRNLDTFEVRLETAELLIPLVPRGRIAVCESGIHGPDDVRRLLAAGASAFLVGEHLMTAPDPARALRELKRCRIPAGGHDATGGPHGRA